MESKLEQKAFVLRVGEFIKFSHTVFALPFALISMLAAGRGRVALPVIGWILVCMVAARTAAMCFNRLADWDFDKENPRTAKRHTLVRRHEGWALMIAALVVFVFGTYHLNRLCFDLAPVVLILVTFYSLTKRFTAFSHFFLGLALAAAPMGAWAAVRGELWSPAPYILAVSVLCWVFGFGLVYATMDVEFDRSKGLFSFPARFGIPAALRLGRWLHVAAALGFLAFGWWAPLGWFYRAACAVTIAALIWEHRIANPSDTTSINHAFFNINALVSVSLLLGATLDLVI